MGQCLWKENIKLQDQILTQALRPPVYWPGATLSLRGYLRIKLYINCTCIVNNEHWRAHS